MNPDELLIYFKKQTGPFAERLREMTAFSTPTGDRDRINGFAGYLTRLFSDFDSRIERTSTEAGDILHCRLFTRYPDFLVFLAHMDTVDTGQSQRPHGNPKHIFTGTGAYDMKSGIALFYFVLQAIRHFNIKMTRAVNIILTPDEESGSTFSMPYLLKACRKARAVLLPEPSGPDGAIKIRRKGVTRLKANLTGRTSHSGIEPEKGIDANRGLVQLIIRIEKVLQQYHDLSFNPGIISGGRQINQVSGESCLMGEIRSFSNHQLDQAAKELKSIKKLDDIRVDWNIEPVHPALEPGPSSRALADLALKIAAELGNPISTCSSGGSSDGSNLTVAGIPVLDGLGMKGSGAHSEDERVNLSDFPFRAALLTRLAVEI